jgi:hypothetical protein
VQLIGDSTPRLPKDDLVRDVALPLLNDFVCSRFDNGDQRILIYEERLVG